MPLVAVLVAGSRAAPALQVARRWLISHGHTLVLVGLGAVGVELTVVGARTILA